MALSINGTQHNNGPPRRAGCHYAECRVLFTTMLSVIMLYVAILSVVMLTVVELNVVAPSLQLWPML